MRVPGAAGRLRQGAVAQQLLVDLHLLGHPQAVGHLDDEHPIQEGLVVLIVAEGLPLRLIGVGQDDALEGQGGEPLGAVVIALLGSRQ